MNYQAIYYAARMIKAYCEQADCDSCPFNVHNVWMGHNIDECRIGSWMGPCLWELEAIEDEIKNL